MARDAFRIVQDRLHADLAKDQARKERREKQLAELLASATDADLCAAYDLIVHEPGNPEADALLVEIERRGLDF